MMQFTELLEFNQNVTWLSPRQNVALTGPHRLRHTGPYRPYRHEPGT